MHTLTNYLLAVIAELVSESSIHGLNGYIKMDSGSSPE